ncbi:MAG TPA: MinD/ParA family protein [Acidobacteriota bacterium]|nr:MinD/ParA family protein [Acidobacteriota bacterium]
MDQATELRRAIESLQLEPVIPGPVRSKCQVLAVTSGKGGVGKTYVVVNLALALRKQGKRVVILDGDFGLANVDVLLGITPKYHLGHVIEGIQTLRGIIVEGPDGVHIIPASSGIQELTRMGERHRRAILDQLVELFDEYDFVLIDTAAGISDNVTRLLAAALRVIVVCNPEPTALVDAYALIKVLLRKDGAKEVLLLVNSVQDQAEAVDVFQQLAEVAKRFLGAELQLLGSIPRDSRVHESVRRQLPLVLSHPSSMVSRCFGRIAQELIKHSQNQSVGSRLS